MGRLLCDQTDDPSLWSTQIGRNLPTCLFVTPTDTVYGLATAYNNTVGIEKIRVLKRRENAKFLTLVRNIDEAKQLAQIDPPQESLLQRYWPGPYTFVFFKPNSSETIALRNPKSVFLKKLMNVLDGPIISTSCNLSGTPPVKSIQAALELFGDDVDVYVDGGPPEKTQPSTLVDLTTRPFKILRQGAGHIDHALGIE